MQTVRLFKRSILLRGPFCAALQVSQEMSKSKCSKRRPLSLATKYSLARISNMSGGKLKIVFGTK
jgi:hypothetical protein